MSVFSDTATTASAEGAAQGLSGAYLANHVRMAVEAACGPMPIKVAAGWVTAINYLTDGRPIYRIDPP